MGVEWYQELIWAFRVGLEFRMGVECTEAGARTAAAAAAASLWEANGSADASKFFKFFKWDPADLKRVLKGFAAEKGMYH